MIMLLREPFAQCQLASDETSDFGRVIRLTLLIDHAMTVSMSDLPLRHTARALLFDPSDRLLLIQYEAARDIEGRAPGDRLFWYTPGGGIDPGETPEQACQRELGEEVGLHHAHIGPLVARWAGPLRLFIRETQTDAQFFLVRAENDRIDTRDLQATEMDPVHDVRWMSLAELRAVEASIVPSGIVPLVQRILSGTIPATPMSLGKRDDRSTSRQDLSD
jgi:8-oxo-dGTP pyrophosphatase MutT (NUDIX family)